MKWEIFLFLCVTTALFSMEKEKQKEEPFPLEELHPMVQNIIASYLDVSDWYETDEQFKKRVKKRPPDPRVQRERSGLTCEIITRSGCLSSSRHLLITKKNKKKEFALGCWRADCLTISSRGDIALRTKNKDLYVVQRKVPLFLGKIFKPNKLRYTLRMLNPEDYVEEGVVGSKNIFSISFNSQGTKLGIALSNARVIIIPLEEEEEDVYIPKLHEYFAKKGICKDLKNSTNIECQD